MAKPATIVSSGARRRRLLVGLLVAAPVLCARGTEPDPELQAEVRDANLVPLDRLPMDELLAALVRARVPAVPSTRGDGPTFAELVRQPEEHHGQVVRLRGSLRRALRHELPPNPEAIGQFHELWVFTEDSRVNPYVVIAGGVPAELPLGAGLREQVELVGTFQFLVSYRAADTLRKAPLVVADQVTWRPSAAPTAPRGRALGPFAWLAAALSSLILWRGLVAWSRRQQAARASGGRHVAVDPRLLQSLEPLGGAPVPDLSPLAAGDDFGDNQTSDEDRRRAREAFGANGGQGPGPAQDT